MPKQTTVVEFNDTEIREILREKAKETVGKSIQGGVEISIAVCAGDSNVYQCRVTFSGKPAA